MVNIYCLNTGSSMAFEEGTMLLDVAKGFGIRNPYPFLAAKVNNVTEGLKYRVYNSKDVEFLDYTSYIGRGTYCRSLCFLVCKAARDLFPDSILRLRRPVSKGYFCDLSKADGTPLEEEDVRKIEVRMRELVAADIEFHRHEGRLEDVLKLFRKYRYADKVKLFESSGSVYVNYYTLDGTVDYFYDALVPSTGYLKVWSLGKYRHGMLLRVPDRHQPDELAPFFEQPKTFEVFLESERWNKIMRLGNVGDVNKACLGGAARELIQVSEALQEKKIVQIAEDIYNRYHAQDNPVRIVLITGPSSSGKTTVCRKLRIQLMAC